MDMLAGQSTEVIEKYTGGMLGNVKCFVAGECRDESD